MSEDNVNVIDSSSRFGAQRTVQMLADAGVFPDDETRGAILVAKRLNHGLRGDFSKEGLSGELLAGVKLMQTRYNQKLQEAPYEQLVADGTLNNLLNEYMEFLVKRSAEKLKRLESGELKAEELNPATLNLMKDQESRKLHALKGEQQTYASSPDYTRKMLERIEPLVKLDKYAPLGKLVVKSGLVQGDVTQVDDMVSDVLGASSARQVKSLAAKFESLAALAGQPDSPASQARSEAMALAVRQGTQPVSSLFEFEPESPELDRINALKALLSAQLHQAFSQPHLSTQWEQLEEKAQEVANDYAKTTMSLAYHYMGTGAAAGDARVQKLQANLKAEMDRDGIALLSQEEAVAKAGQLARASASDLLYSIGGNKEQAAIVNALAKAAGAKVELQALEPRRQLMAHEISDPHDPTVAVSKSFLERLQEQAASAASKLGLAS